MPNKPEYQFIYGAVSLPERRPVEPVGRIIFMGRELSLEETKNYLKSLRRLNQKD